MAIKEENMLIIVKENFKEVFIFISRLTLKVTRIYINCYQFQRKMVFKSTSQVGRTQK
jgi:hypothetical protein